jgi:hypothetical protein
MKVKIYQPSRSTMQSGRGKTKGVILEYTDLSARGPEPLMGWTASADTLNQVKMTFESIAAAVAHATAQGWEYTVDLAHERRVVPRNYTDKFRYIPPVEKTTRA